MLMELFVAFDYARRMNKENVDHIHAHFGDRKYFIGYFCKHLINKPLSVTIHAHEIYVNPNDEFFRYAIQDADKVVSISDLNRDILINQYGVNQDRIEVIRLSVDLDVFKKEQDCIRVLTVARFTERKGFYELLQVIRDYGFEKVHFYIVGFGPLDLDQLVKDYSISEYVTVFNKMNSQQLAFFYKTCDIFCLPSKSTMEEGSEGIPVVLMEAMASEMIIVATNNGATSELVDNILVDEGSVHSLAEGLRKAIGIARDADLSQRIGGANRERVLDLHGEANVDSLKQYLYD